MKEKIRPVDFIETRPRTLLKSEIADMYGITQQTLMIWISSFRNELDTIQSISKRAKYFSPNQVRLIFQKLGEP